MNLKYLALTSGLLFFLVACNANSAKGVADYEMAVSYMRGNGVAKDAEKAMTYFMSAADAGNSSAQLIMGYYYLKGSNGVLKDAAKAIDFFTKSAKQGNRDAQYNVGLAYVRGEGVAKDFAKAYTWFEKAGFQDDVGAQYNLGVMSVNGEGRVADPLAAYVWFKLADEKGYEGAKEGMETARKNMTEDQAKEIDAAYAKILGKIKKPVESATADNTPL